MIWVVNFVVPAERCDGEIVINDTYYNRLGARGGVVVKALR
jgi:hypothetical protein